MNPEADKRHRRSIRLDGYDYSQAGAYFVTVCTQGKISLFGRVESGRVVLNGAGQMVADSLKELNCRFPNLTVDESVVMPNHLHVILILSDTDVRPYGTMPGSIGRIIQAFKSITTHRYVGKVKTGEWPAFPGRVWQRNYHEHIIRNEQDLNDIRRYIRDNPMRWDMDEENPARRHPEGRIAYVPVHRATYSRVPPNIPAIVSPTSRQSSTEQV